MVGDLAGFVNDVYMIKTNLALVRVRWNLATCQGADCPKTTPTDVDVRTAGSDKIGAELMPLLIKGYVQTMGAAAPTKEGNGDTMFRALLGERGSSTGFWGPHPG